MSNVKAQSSNKNKSNVKFQNLNYRYYVKTKNLKKSMRNVAPPFIGGDLKWPFPFRRQYLPAGRQECRRTIFRFEILISFDI